MAQREIAGIRIHLASPERIRELSSGEVKKPETINYRTLRPEKDGLFCERIFGPVRSYECACGKYKRTGPRFKGIVCDRCGVEITDSRVRRERMGHIELAAPVVHLWYLRGIPSRLSLLVGAATKDLERVVYFAPIRRHEVLYKVVIEGRRVDLAHRGDLIPACEERIHSHYDTKFKAEEAYRIVEVDDISLEEGDLLSLQQVNRYRAEYGEGVFKVEPAFVLLPSEDDGALPKEGGVIPASRLEKLKEEGAEPQTERAMVGKQEAFVVTAVVHLPFAKGDIISSSEYQLYMSKYPGRFSARQETVVAEDACYLVINKGSSPFDHGDIITESEERLCSAYDKEFSAGIGAEGVLAFLKQLNLDELTASLREEIAESSGQRKRKLIKRLQVVEDFRKSDNKPEWMILEALPVIPPELRPMVQLDGGRFATSDLNDLYRRVINRNNRLKKLQELKAPEIIIRNEKRMLQEAVDALFDNGRVGKAVLGAGNRPLKSLTDLLRGKKGRFRQNLLGKRVDYSGRSVIVVGPNLKIYQCGLPKQMALELFKPFVMHKLVENSLAVNMRSAKRMIERGSDEVWGVLEEIIKDHPVLLNRAPTLHRLSIQAFEPVLTEGKAISLHPLACTAFNADFDGDQMAVHVPLSLEAQSEARVIMLSAHNLLSPAHGRPIVTPTQDIILGIYYLTGMRGGLKGEGMYFKDTDDVLSALDHGIVHINSKIKFLLNNGEWIETSPGRVLFNSAMPAELPFINEGLDKKAISRLFEVAHDKVEHSSMVQMLDAVKALGFRWATNSGASFNVNSVVIPPEKDKIVKDTLAQEEELYNQYGMGVLTEEEYLRQKELLWSDAARRIADHIMEDMDDANPLKLMVESGARGSKSQLAQMAGIRGLMADPSGRIIDYPITANFREGLNMLEYFISTHGARKGLADTALRTAKSGYLTRRLVDVGQDLIIVADDCGTTDGIYMSAFVRDGKVAISLSERIYGRTALKDVFDPKTGQLIVAQGDFISQEAAEAIEKAGIEGVWIRSPMTCGLRYGICRKCYGFDLSMRELVSIGEAVGVVAAQSIGEPGTQLTLRTFHTGGVHMAGEDITQGLPRIEQLFEVRKPKKEAILSEIDGIVAEIREMEGKRKIVVHSSDGGEHATYTILSNQSIVVEEGSAVKRGQVLTEGYVDPQKLLEVKGLSAVQSYLLDNIQEEYRSQGVSINNKHIEVILRKVAPPNRVRIIEEGDSSFVAGELAWMDDLCKEIEEIRRDNERYLTEAEELLEASVLRDVMGTGGLEGALQFKGENLSRDVLRQILRPGSAVSELLVEDQEGLLRVIVGEASFRREMEGLELVEPFGDEAGHHIDAGVPLRLSQLNLITQLSQRPILVRDVKRLNALCDKAYLAADVVVDGEVLAHRDRLLAADVLQSLRSADVAEIKVWYAPEVINVVDRMQEYLIAQIWGHPLSRVITASGELMADAPSIVDGSIVRGIIEGNIIAIEVEGKVLSREGILKELFNEIAYGKVLLEPVYGTLRDVVVEAGREINQEIVDKLVAAEPQELVLRPIYAQSRLERIIQRVSFVRRLREEPQWKPVVLGVTKAALATESFLSAASFQQTAQSLASAAVRGDIDLLRGLKENVIIGHLIPAGTGVEAYRKIEVSAVGEAPQKEEGELREGRVISVA